MKGIRITKLLPSLVLACGFITTYLLQHAAFDATRQIQQDNFAYQADDIKLRIEQRLATYEQVLHGVQGLLTAANAGYDQRSRNPRRGITSRT